MRHRSHRRHRDRSWDGRWRRWYAMTGEERERWYIEQCRRVRISHDRPRARRIRALQREAQRARLVVDWARDRPPSRQYMAGLKFGTVVRP